MAMVSWPSSGTPNIGIMTSNGPKLKPSLAELMLMQGLIDPYGMNRPASTGTRILHNGFRGAEYAKRKSRSKLAKQSRKRNR